MALDAWHTAEEIRKAVANVGGGTWPIRFIDPDTGEVFEMVDVKPSKEEQKIYVRLDLVENP